MEGRTKGYIHFLFEVLVLSVFLGLCFACSTCADLPSFEVCAFHIATHLTSSVRSRARKKPTSPNQCPGAESEPGHEVQDFVLQGGDGEGDLVGGAQTCQQSGASIAAVGCLGAKTCAEQSSVRARPSNLSGVPACLVIGGQVKKKCFGCDPKPGHERGCVTGFGDLIPFATPQRDPKVLDVHQSTNTRSPPHFKATLQTKELGSSEAPNAP